MENPKGALTDRYGAPPFSVLDARQGYWAKRKREWQALGIRGEEGREGLKAFCVSPGMNPKLKAIFARSNTCSVFDPVLAELCVRWFSAPGWHVLDPFAGEATKGLVAAVLARDYTGIELRAEQVTANERQAVRVGFRPKWICGDSARLDALLPPGALYDLVFTSPPLLRPGGLLGPQRRRLGPGDL